MQPKKPFKRVARIVIVIVLVVFLAMAIRPLPKPTNDNCEQHAGKVLQVIKGEGEADIVIKLQNDINHYYINRGLERGLTIEKLTENLTNKTATLYTIKHWTLLDPLSGTKHIAKIVTNDTVIYSEFQ